jgi:hypothetical protein
MCPHASHAPPRFGPRAHARRSCPRPRPPALPAQAKSAAAAIKNVKNAAAIANVPATYPAFTGFVKDIDAVRARGAGRAANPLAIPPRRRPRAGRRRPAPSAAAHRA